MKYHFKIHKEDGGFWAECLELPGCVTQADTIEELCDNMQEALCLYVSEPMDSTMLPPFPNPRIKLSKTVVEVPLEADVAFAFMMRYFRLKYRLTQAQAAKKMGFDTIYSYQRLESKRCNPNLKTLSRVKETFPEFSLDLAVF